MFLPSSIIVNADDFGLNENVNNAILYCFDHKIINSTSLMTNKAGFDGAIDMIHKNQSIKNVGIHVNFADGKPLTDFANSRFINSDGEWNLEVTGAKLRLLKSEESVLVRREIEAQIEKANAEKIVISHLDSHHHLHTLPGLYPLFIDAAQRFKLKLRLAQTHSSGNYLKNSFRKFLNKKITDNDLNYSDYFETVDVFVKRKTAIVDKVVEIMIHPGFDDAQQLTDHYAPDDMKHWLNWFNKP